PHTDTRCQMVGRTSSQPPWSFLRLLPSARFRLRTGVPLCVYFSSASRPSAPEVWIVLVISCCLSFHGEPLHGRAVFHPGPVAAGSETVGDVPAADALIAPPLDECNRFGLVVLVRCEANADLGPSELQIGRA